MGVKGKPKKAKPKPEPMVPLPQIMVVGVEGAGQKLDDAIEHGHTIINEPRLLEILTAAAKLP